MRDGGKLRRGAGPTPFKSAAHTLIILRLIALEEGSTISADRLAF
ncbi:hypothetical protein N5W20_06635 [Candidatus Kirkpatrickella diaphorinae]|uniref:Transcriptional regulator n=1 Tax=Candidatus Kirkpatrickella diaphorinae TaxID=2984322 RepID=A0ABY6GH05_9PROT|nr:hypothetical protein [Candidatus Kirkpatrickella diaphorinae]UYH50786.1 hypothetical protein N5W20_06635 [Candidatus Kirkpatrickella diaphorinae]